MAAQKFTQGTIIKQNDDALTELFLITEGSVRACFDGGEIHLGKGDVIGLCDLAYTTHTCTYIASEDTVAFGYKVNAGSDDLTLPGSSGDFDMLLLNSMIRQTCAFLDSFVLLEFNSNNLYSYLKERYEEYVILCSKYIISPKALPGFELIQPFTTEDSIASWLTSYYEAMSKLTPEQKKAMAASRNFLIGILLKASLDTHAVFSLAQQHYDYECAISSVLLNEDHLDFLDLYTGILTQATKNNADTTALSTTIGRMMIYMESLSSIDQNLYKTRNAQYRQTLEKLESAPAPRDASATSAELKNSLDAILRYADIDPEEAATFKSSILNYKLLQDRNAQTDEASKLRRTITKLFYDIYNITFQVSLTDPNVPLPVKLFLNFGFVDEELAGLSNATYLASIVDTLKPNPEIGVYTLYEWLKAIYNGEKEPSRNAFETDYATHVREMRVSGRITPDIEKKMLQDNAQKVMFELENLFPTANKITYGRVSTFCPVFSEHNVLKELKDMLVTPELVARSFRDIRAVDFSAFYRDTVYSYPSVGVNQEFVPIEILPELILFPNVGTRGIMWQEISGRDRNTPARMLASIFSLSELHTLLIRMTGEYRWEICRRIQGGRWNDLSDPSLTSEYFDYIQFYRKNHDLSTDAKEKIKTALTKARNSYREMFVMDYIMWIQYESVGSPRLNKVSRTILFSYCPFAADVRAKLQVNPLYRELLTKYDLKKTQKLHRMDNLLHRFTSANVPIPAELEHSRAYIES